MSNGSGSDDIVTGQGSACLDDILITGELLLREVRPAAYIAENQALVGLARDMSGVPQNLLQGLVDRAVELCGAGSAGISLLKHEGGRTFFQWEAMAGVYAQYAGGTTPRDHSPCGVTLDRGEPQLFHYPGRYFTYFNAVSPPIVEGLVVPFHLHGAILGTIWIVSHDGERKFDQEDVRIMTSLAEFTAAALRTLLSVEATRRANDDLQRIADALRESELMLKQADLRKDEFLATLAHELRNPLAPIRSALELMRLGDEELAEQARMVMDRQVNQLVRLVDDLLEVSRITRGKLELCCERVDVARIVGDAIETSRPVIEAGNHELVVRLPETPLMLDADPLRLSQVIANLLNNAAKYTDHGGRIRLLAEHADGEAVIRISDNGIGIARDMLPHVFDMFTQVDRSQRRSQGGLGIGLTLVQRLVAMHGGRVEVSSEGAGQGSEFMIVLPLAAGEPAVPGYLADPPAPAAPSPLRILVADDNRDAAESLAALLSLLGNEVRIAYSGDAVLEMIAAYEPAVLLLDLGMPGMDGYEVARRVAARPELAGVTLVALSGWGQAEDLRKCMAAGFHHHLVKPVGVETLKSLFARLH